jgi:glutathione synthase
MKLLFVMDPLSTVNVRKDTTYALMHEAHRRGWSTWMCLPSTLLSRAEDVLCRACEVRFSAGEAPVGGSWQTLSLREFDQVWMRKDPPFDMAFFHATLQLEHAEQLGVRVVNRPSSLRAANEKAFILRFGDVSPKSIVTCDRAHIREFVRECGGRAVLKPLDRMGGAGIFLVNERDPNYATILEQGTQYDTEVVMVQAFVPQASEGDKRVLLMDGEVLGAMLRVPKDGEFRGNLAAGGSAVPCEVTARDLEIVERVAPTLRSMGLWFVGLDVLGGWLTEVNVTSPTGIQEIMKFGAADAASRTWDLASALGTSSEP